EIHLYSVGFRYYFKNMMVRDDAASRMLVMFPRADGQPLYYTSNISITPYLKYQPDAGILFADSNGAAITSRLFDLEFHWQSALNTILESPDIQDLASASRSKFRKLGGEFLWQTNIRFTKTPETLKDS